MTNWLAYNKPQIKKLELPELRQFGVSLTVRREDQNHPFVSGNKWWKLKHNLIFAKENRIETIVTFGGAYSNHIYATAAACRELEIHCVGMIRGEETLPLNSTLRFAKEYGMELDYVSREDYRSKKSASFLESISRKYDRCMIIPEGGTNELALKGSEELGEQLLQDDFDFLCLPVGTGGTIAGIINSFDHKRKIIGVPVLKDDGYLDNEIKKFLKADFSNWQLIRGYDFGGYAKTSKELNSFIEDLASQEIQTEFVYSGKLFFAVLNLVRKGWFERGSNVMILHTGGFRP